ncbi:MAG: hypothetical protein ABSD56_09200 [Bryobacteraceae bacterium]
MLRAIVATPDPAAADQLRLALEETGRAGVVRVLSRYPDEHELLRILRAHAPQLFFVDVSPLKEALQMAALVAEHAPGAQVLAFDRQRDPGTLLELMRAGIREFLAVPCPPDELGAVLDRATAALEHAPTVVRETDELIAFLPAKPGVGCSTVALNTAVALAADGANRVLLIDFDLNCGIIGFLLHITAEYSVVDAAEHAAHLDEQLWTKLVTKCGNLDVLPSGPIRLGFRIEPPAMRYLIDFARRNYDFICVDLSGLMERFSVELMQECKRIYLVCTPELPALHLARQKLEYLRSLELESRITVLLNRAQKRALVSGAEVEKALGLPVTIEIPNDYRGVHQALSDAKPVLRNSDLGKCFTKLAGLITAKEAPAKPAHRLVEYFSIVPARYSSTGPAQEQ